ncbi:MAG TPA: RodZ domain-containing protein [Burkholderiales bacterium]|nr:RodZ domain-containing protein [Burkholderiales bacterium]
MSGASDTLSFAAGAAPSGTAPGARLARAREQQNLSAADIARQLKLSVSQVEALEAGRYHQLPGPVFVRGFIRNYARLVKLDPEELLREAGESLPRPAARPEAPPSRGIPFPSSRPRSWRRYAVAAGFIVAGLAAYEFVLMNEPGTGPAVSVTPVSLPVAPPERPAMPSGSAPAPSAGDGAAAAPAAGETAPAARDEPAASAEAGEGARAAAVAAREDEPQPRPGERVVRLEFTEECWVEIRDRNGRVVFSQLNRPGTVQHVSGLPPLAIVVGNAHGVRMSYEGETVDLARHTKIDVARLTLP